MTTRPRAGEATRIRSRATAWALAAVVFSAGVALPAAAAAQPREHRPRDRGTRSGGPRRSELRRAAALVRQGAALADRQQWAAALDALDRAVAIAPLPGAGLLRAEALLRLGHPRDAFTALEALVAAPDADAVRAARARSLRAEARARLAEVTLRGVPDGAEVRVDEVTERGEGAVRALLLEPGTRRFEVRAGDGPAERFELALPGGASVTRDLAAPAPVAVPSLTQAAAQAAFEQGRRALREQRYDQAAAAFHEAARREPTPGTWRWLGVALRSMGRYTEAIGAFERYLAAPEPGARAEVLAQVRLTQAELQAALGRVMLTVSPPHAALLVDARPRAVGSAEVVLDPGEHVLELRAEGYRPLRQEVTLGQNGQVVLNLRLEEAVTPPAPLAPPALPAATARGPGAGPWVLVGVGAGLLAGSAVLYGLRGASLQDVNAVCDEGTSLCVRGTEAQSAASYESAQRYELAAAVALGFGAAAVAGGVVWRLLARPGGAPTQSLSVNVSPSRGGAWITVGGAL